MFDKKKIVRSGLVRAALVISLPATKEFVLSGIYRKTVALPVRAVIVRVILGIASMQLLMKDRSLTILKRLA